MSLSNPARTGQHRVGALSVVLRDSGDFDNEILKSDRTCQMLVQTLNEVQKGAERGNSDFQVAVDGGQTTPCKSSAYQAERTGF